MSEYFIKRGDRVHGFTREQIMGFAKAKKITGSDLVGNSPEGPFQELKTVWESIKNPSSITKNTRPTSPVSDVNASKQKGSPPPLTDVPVVKPKIDGATITPEIKINTRQRVAASPLPTTSSSNNKALLLIGGASAFAIILLIIGLIIVFKGSSRAPEVATVTEQAAGNNQPDRTSAQAIPAQAAPARSAPAKINPLASLTNETAVLKIKDYVEENNILLGFVYSVTGEFFYSIDDPKCEWPEIRAVLDFPEGIVDGVLQGENGRHTPWEEYPPDFSGSPSNFIYRHYISDAQVYTYDANQYNGEIEIDFTDAYYHRNLERVTHSEFTKGYYFRFSISNGKLDLDRPETYLSKKRYEMRFDEPPVKHASAFIRAILEDRDPLLKVKNALDEVPVISDRNYSGKFDQVFIYDRELRKYVLGRNESKADDAAESDK